MDRQILDVYLNSSKVGELSTDGKLQNSFTYSQAWLSQADSFPISLSLPLQNEAFSNDQTRAFFANLLPEGQVRLRISKLLGVSENNDFAMLTAMAGDTAGALSLHKSDYVSELPQAAAILTVEEIKELSRQPFLLADKKIRVSLAGAQNKLPINIVQNQMVLPTQYQSDHIIKPALQDFPSSVENEWFCMKLARALTLPVPMVNKLREPSVYIVKRYDRKVQANAITKLHQEDFCQALGIPPEQKYTPTLAQCFNLLRQHSRTPARDIHLLLQWVIFNFLIGNSDGHAKNIALFLDADGISLAPFYDLLSTAVYPALTSKLAMPIGGEDDPEKISHTHWREFAKEIGIKAAFMEKILFTLTNNIVAKSTALLTAIPNNAIVAEIVEIIHKRAEIYHAKM